MIARVGQMERHCCPTCGTGYTLRDTAENCCGRGYQPNRKPTQKPGAGDTGLLGFWVGGLAGSVFWLLMAVWAYYVWWSK